MLPNYGNIPAVKTITERRFWAKVRKTKKCWLWTASVRNKGYGAFVYPGRDGRTIQGRAHRYSWEIHRGEIPAGLCVLHLCDTPACVNPEHLFLGTKAENNRDMVRKGRHVRGGTYSRAGYRRGVAHHNAKLNPETVAELRKDRVAGLSYSALAGKFGISIGHAWRIVNGRGWRQIGGGSDAGS